MIFSKLILGTETNNPKMSWWEYIFTHLIPTSIKSFQDNFRMWADLVWWENYEPYKLLKTDDPFEECRSWFFSSINMDETYPKDFLEALMQMAEDVKSGKVETVPYTKEMFDELFDLVGDQMDDPITGTLEPEDE